MRTRWAGERRIRNPKGAGSLPPESEVQRCARLLPSGPQGDDLGEGSAPRWSSLGLRGSEAALFVPGLLGAESGAAHSSPRVAAQGSDGWSTQLMGSYFIPGSEKPARGAAPPGTGAGREEGASRTPPPRRRGPPRAPGSGSGPARAPPGHSLIRASRVSGSMSGSICHGPPASAPPPAPLRSRGTSSAPPSAD